MQYILSEDEYKSLVKKSKVDELEKKVNDLNKLVLEISKFPCIHAYGGLGIVMIAQLHFLAEEIKTIQNS